MKPCTQHIAFIAFVIFITHTRPVSASEYLLYTPQAVPSGQPPASQEGILVQKIEIEKGDTLYDISRKFSGHGMYFPQILLFNSITNPDLIYAGNTLKVPVNQGNSGININTEKARTSKVIKRKKTRGKSKETSQKSAGVLPAKSPTVELSLSDLNALGTGRTTSKRPKSKLPLAKARSKSARKDSKTDIYPTAVATAPPLHPSDPATVAAQQLFESAVKAYRRDDCGTALKLLDRYLADNSKSPLAADASLYRAECYLKLSAP